MNEIIKSVGWNWEIVSGDNENVWKNPAPESFYLLSRWISQHKKEILDLGCGLGRHSILFAKNGFNVFAFDISENAIARTKEWAETENLIVDFAIGDMLNLPYQDNSMDCILCRNVISHTDTNGVKQIIKELYRILKSGGECYLTLGSKDTWGFKKDWPMVDENTKLRMDQGPEYKVPHFYADYDLIGELFKEFQIVDLEHVCRYYEVEGELSQSYHYHILIRKD